MLRYDTQVGENSKREIVVRIIPKRVKKIYIVNQKMDSASQASAVFSDTPPRRPSALPRLLFHLRALSNKVGIGSHSSWIRLGKAILSTIITTYSFIFLHKANSLLQSKSSFASWNS